MPPLGSRHCTLAGCKASVWGYSAILTAVMGAPATRIPGIQERGETGAPEAILCEDGLNPLSRFFAELIH